ncbi:MAG: hypothetical protein HYY10_00125 [Candidatus Liptonbacteria bacterium]|nr:hypothetical protein [Candidatus Liptonbacteria bacterium]
MNLLTTLKKLRHAQPDPGYQSRSRHIILQTTPPLPRLQMVGRWILGNIESAATLALAGLCLFLVFAGFSLWKSFSPLGIAQLDLASLRAEAQAIDIQIRLAGLQYEGSTIPIAPATGLPPIPATAASPREAAQDARPVPALAAPGAASPASPSEVATSTPALSIDEALLELSQ